MGGRASPAPVCVTCPRLPHPSPLAFVGGTTCCPVALALAGECAALTAAAPVSRLVEYWADSLTAVVCSCSLSPLLGVCWCAAGPAMVVDTSWLVAGHGELLGGGGSHSPLCLVSHPSHVCVVLCPPLSDPHCVAMLVAGILHACGACLLAGVGGGAGAGECWHMGGACFQVVPAGLLALVGACRTPAVGCWGLCWGSLRCVSYLGDVGGWAATVLLCDLPSLAPPFSPCLWWVGPRAGRSPWPLRAGECGSPDCRRTCFGALSGLPNSCAVPLAPHAPCCGHTDRGLGNGCRHQLVSGGSWMSPWMRGGAGASCCSFCRVSHPSHVSAVLCPTPSHCVAMLVAGFLHACGACLLAGVGGGAGAGECWHLGGACFQVVPAGLLALVGACRTPAVGCRGLCWGSLRCVSYLGDMGGWAATVLSCDLPSLAPPFSLCVCGVGPRAAWSPWSLRAGE
jgi:hypothetical protein